jgi:hypothetical protein
MFDVNRYFTEIWNQRNNIIGKKKQEVLTTIYDVVNTLAPGAAAPAGARLGLVAIDTRCASGNAMAHMVKYGAAADAHASGVHVAMLGENHDDRTDKLRGQNIGRRLGVSPMQPSMVLYEKGLSGKYPVPNVDASRIVKEEDIIPGFSPSIRARSAIVAGYLALSIASDPGNQKIVLFFGEEHRDIFDMIELIASNTAGAASVLHRYRYYQLVRSYTSNRGGQEDPL